MSRWYCGFKFGPSLPVVGWLRALWGPLLAILRSCSTGVQQDPGPFAQGETEPWGVVLEPGGVTFKPGGVTFWAWGGLPWSLGVLPSSLGVLPVTFGLEWLPLGAGGRYLGAGGCYFQAWGDFQGPFIRI